jgi:hypothetical protein
LASHAASKYSLFFQRIRKLPKGYAYRCLHGCGVGLLVFLLRTHTSEQMALLARAFDAELDSSIGWLLTLISIPSDVRSQLSLRTARGGFGLRQQSALAPLPTVPVLIPSVLWLRLPPKRNALGPVMMQLSPTLSRCPVSPLHASSPRRVISAGW